MKIGKLLTLAILAFASVYAAEETKPGASLDAFLQQPALWQQPLADLTPELKAQGFEWTSSAKDSARSAAPALNWEGQKVYEALLHLKGGKLGAITLILFNRGDAEDLRRYQFEALIENTSKTLTALTGKPPLERGKDPTNAVRAEGLIWETKDTRYLLEWSVTKESKVKMIPFRAEFLRLTISPNQPSITAIGSISPTRTLKVADLAKNVLRSENGDIKIPNVPMVDQGEKGYCVVASVERLMRYYDIPADQHELAQIANSDADQGTNIDVMVASLRKLTSRLGVRTRTLYEWDVQDFLKLIDDYNRIAKRGKRAPEVYPGMYAELSFMKMEPGIFKEVRLKKQADYGRFLRDVQQSIDAGIPLLWTVQLGMVKEKEIPQAFGGHMRTITGYNPKTREILYSDSWGLGHEEKRMSFDDAWTITTGLNSLQPLS